MSERSRQSLRGLTLAVLIPCLLFSATLAGWTTYTDLYHVILNDGFEQKLEAVSTGVAAFIDGDTHVDLGRPTRVTALTGDPTRPVLWALDPEGGRLVNVDMVTGGAERVGPLPISDPTGLVYDIPNGRLITMRASTGELLAFRPDSAEEVVTVAHIDRGAWALALDATSAHLVAAGSWGLRGYDFAGRGDTLRARWTMDVDARAVALSKRTGELYVVRRDGALLVADSSGAPLRALGTLEPGDSEAEPDQLASVQALTTSLLTPMLFAAGSRLVAISPDRRTFEVERFRRGFRDEGGPTYTAYVEPMRRIRTELDLTYLYTQNLVPGDSIQYIVDSTPLGDDHSPIGTREALETEADIRGLADVMDRGFVYSSEIEDSEEWGLLKSTFAPIFGPRGETVGMVGTDISVGTIQDRTQIALAKVGLVTVLILFLGGLGSVAISLRLTGPLAAVQEGASKVAAGRVGEPIEPPRLRDLATLTTSFNEMTQTLTSSVNELREETLRVQAMRTRRHLVQELVARGAARDELPPGVTAEWWGDQADEPAPVDVVVVERGGRRLTVVRVRAPEDSVPLATLAEREELAMLVRRVAAKMQPSAEALASALDRFWDPARGGLVVIDAAFGAVASSSGASLRGVLRVGGAEDESVSLVGGTTFVVPPSSELGIFLQAVQDMEGARDERSAPVIRVRGAEA